MLVTTTAKESHFNLVKAKWNSYTEQQLTELIDPAILDLVRKINQDPDLATMYCCSGHPDRYPENIIVNSYMVLLVRPGQILNVTSMVQWIESCPGYKRISEEPGWSWSGGTLPIRPKDYPIDDHERCNIVALYLKTRNYEGLSVESIVHDWNVLFDHFIFNRASDTNRELYNRIRQHIKESDVKLILPATTHEPVWDLQVDRNQVVSEEPTLTLKVRKNRKTTDGPAVHVRSFSDNFTARNNLDDID